MRKNHQIIRQMKHFVTALGDLIPQVWGCRKKHDFDITNTALHPVFQSYLVIWTSHSSGVKKAGDFDFRGFKLIHISLNPRDDWRITCKPLLATQPPEGVFVSRDPTKKHHPNFHSLGFPRLLSHTFARTAAATGLPCFHVDFYRKVKGH